MENVDIFLLSRNQLGWIQNANSDQPSIGCGFNVSSVTKMLKTLVLVHVPFSVLSGIQAVGYPLAQFSKSLVGILLKIRPKHAQRRGKQRSS